MDERRGASSVREGAWRRISRLGGREEEGVRRCRMGTALGIEVSRGCDGWRMDSKIACVSPEFRGMTRRISFLRVEADGGSRALPMTESLRRE